jgi:hypothetical protein
LAAVIPCQRSDIPLLHLKNINNLNIKIARDLVGSFER